MLFVVHRVEKKLDVSFRARDVALANPYDLEPCLRRRFLNSRDRLLMQLCVADDSAFAYLALLQLKLRFD